MRIPTAALALALLVGCSNHCDEPGQACTVAGTGLQGLGEPGTRAVDADLYWPADVTVDRDGTPIIVDWNNHRILRIADFEGEGILEAITGGGLTGDPIGEPVSQALWNHPSQVIVREDGVLVVAAWHNSRVVALDLATDEVELLAGTGERAYSGDGGEATLATFDLPASVAYGEDGRLYVTDSANHRIRCIDAQGVIQTVVGSGETGPAVDGPALEATFSFESSQNALPAGRIAVGDGEMFIADTRNQRIRRVDMSAWTIETVMGSGGFEDIGTGPLETGLRNPRDVALGPDGALYVADTDSDCVRRLRDGVVETVLGVCGERGFDELDGPATEMLLNQPMGLDVGPDGAAWVADTWNNRVVRVAPE